MKNNLLFKWNTHTEEKQKRGREVAQQFCLPPAAAASCFTVSPECCIMGAGPQGCSHCRMTSASQLWSACSESDMDCFCLTARLITVETHGRPADEQTDRRLVCQRDTEQEEEGVDIWVWFSCRLPPVSKAVSVCFSDCQLHPKTLHLCFWPRQ